MFSVLIFFFYHPLSLKLDSRVLILGIQFGTNSVVMLLCAGNFFGVFLDFLVDIQKIHLEKGKIIFLLLFPLLMELHQQ